MRSCFEPGKMLIGLAIATSTLLASSAALATSFDYLTQERSVSSNSAIDGGVETFSAVGFDPFIATASTLGGSATQSSWLFADQIELEVSTNSYDAASSRALFSVTFSIFEDVAFSLTGEISSFNCCEQPFLRLAEMGGDILYESDASFISVTPFDVSGILSAGTYELSAAAHGDGFVGDGQVSALLAIPEPTVSVTFGLGLAVLGWRRRRCA